jgi:hypothetical protein
MVLPCTVVATTYSSREAKSLRSRRPVTTSLRPPLYTSAVSKKTTPPSTARRTIGSAAGSSSDQGRLSCLPKLIIPRHTRETRRPALPRFTYRIAASFAARRPR